MFITSQDKLEPFVYIDDDYLRMDIRYLKCLVVMQTNEAKNETRGELIGMCNDVLSKGISVRCLNDIDTAAKKLMEFRPELTEETPAAVILYNPTKDPHILRWLQVDKFGQIQPFFNVKKVDVPENGACLEISSKNRIFYSPVDAVTALYQDVLDDIKTLCKEFKTKEDDENARAKAKKPLIELINKSQQF